MTPFTIYTANTAGAQQNTIYPNEVTVDNLTALEQAMRRVRKVQRQRKKRHKLPVCRLHPHGL